MVQTEGGPGGAGKVDVEVEEEEEDVGVYEGVVESVGRGHEVVPWEDGGYDCVGGGEGAGAGWGGGGGGCRRGGFCCG